MFVVESSIAPPPDFVAFTLLENRGKPAGWIIRPCHNSATTSVASRAPRWQCWNACPILRPACSTWRLVIDYAPADWLIESKSLKLYLASFRNHGAFHEDCTLAIGRRIVETALPAWLRIGGYWYPRGGIPIDVFWQTGPAPEGLWLPDQGVPAYRGR